MLFVVVDGRIEVVKHIDGIERKIGERLPGVPFGEVPLVHGTQFQAGYRAAEPSRVIRLEARLYYGIAAASPDIVRRMGELAAERIGGLQDIAAEACTVKARRSWASDVTPTAWSCMPRQARPILIFHGVAKPRLEKREWTTEGYGVENLLEHLIENGPGDCAPPTRWSAPSSRNSSGAPSRSGSFPAKTPSSASFPPSSSRSTKNGPPTPRPYIKWECQDA
jgi:hypothetical protein